MQKLLVFTESRRDNIFAFIDDTLQNNVISSKQPSYKIPKSIEWLIGIPHWIKDYPTINLQSDSDYFLLPHDFKLPDGTLFLETTNDDYEITGSTENPGSVTFHATGRYSRKELKTCSIPAFVFAQMWDEEQKRKLASIL